MDELKEPTQEEIAQAKAEREALKEMRKQHELNSTGESCPNCDHFPLESETFGYERSIFCTNCPYQITEDM